MSQSVTIKEVVAVIHNQLQAEKQMGADEAQMALLTAVLDDVLHLLRGGFIVGGVRI